MESWAYFVEAFTKVKEGDGTLLDNTLIYATTDTAWARIHSLDGVPLFTAGRGGGRVPSAVPSAAAGVPCAAAGVPCAAAGGIG